MNRHRRPRLLLGLIGVGALFAVGAAVPSAAYAQAVNSKGAANGKAANAQGNAQNDKKPGQTCEGLDKKTKAYSDCVKKQAQTTKTDKQPANDKGKPKAKTN